MSANLDIRVDARTNLEASLTALRRYGKPWLFVGASGDWICKFDMHVAAVGASFEIKSDAMKMPSLAVGQCHQRIEETLKIYKEMS